MSDVKVTMSGNGNWAYDYGGYTHNSAHTDWVWADYAEIERRVLSAYRPLKDELDRLGLNLGRKFRSAHAFEPWTPWTWQLPSHSQYRHSYRGPLRLQIQIGDLYADSRGEQRNLRRLGRLGKLQSASHSSHRQRNLSSPNRMGVRNFHRTR